MNDSRSSYTTEKGVIALRLEKLEEKVKDLQRDNQQHRESVAKAKGVIWALAFFEVVLGAWAAVKQFAEDAL